jgi:hypothetical protein
MFKALSGTLLVTASLVFLATSAADAAEPTTYTGQVAVRSTTYGLVIAVEEADGASRDFFFRSNVPMESLAHHEARGLLVASTHELRLVLPSAQLALRLTLPEAVGTESPTLEARSILGANTTVRYAMESHGIDREVAVTEGFEIRTYAPAMEGLSHDQLLTGSEVEFRATLEALQGPEQLRIGDLDAILQDSTNNPGGGGCTSSTSSTCSIDCQGGSGCSITCTNGRCGSCTCNLDVPTCTCS